MVYKPTLSFRNLKKIISREIGSTFYNEVTIYEYNTFSFIVDKIYLNSMMFKYYVKQIVKINIDCYLGSERFYQHDSLK